MAFTGIPVAALDFYDDLEMDNSRTFWQEHREVYEQSVKAPMKALLETLAPEFGEGKLFRPHRDVRFSKDKTPYKTHQGVFVSTGPAAGHYCQVDAAGVMIAAGWYAADAPTLAAIRHHIDADGRRLASLVKRLARTGWEIGGDRLVTKPRGWPVDHPYIELLRHKTLTVQKRYDNDPVTETAGFADVVAKDWRTSRPLLDWMVQALKP